MAAIFLPLRLTSKTTMEYIYSVCSMETCCMFVSHLKHPLYDSTNTMSYPIQASYSWQGSDLLQFHGGVGINHLQISTPIAIHFQCLPTPAHVINPSKEQRLRRISNDFNIRSITEALQVGTIIPLRNLGLKPNLPESY